MRQVSDSRAVFPQKDAGGAGAELFFRRILPAVPGIFARSSDEMFP